MTKLYKV